MEFLNMESLTSAMPKLIENETSIIYDMGNDCKWEMPKKKKLASKNSLMLWWILTTIFVTFLTFGGYFLQNDSYFDDDDTISALEEKILISIQAHTLDNCIGTVESAFKLATNPYRLQVIIVNTNNTFLNRSCLDGFEHPDSGSETIQEAFDNGQLIELSIKETGIEYARTKAIDFILSKIDFFDFILETKVGALFTYRWDEEIIGEWLRAADENAILTTYPSRASEQSRREFDHNKGATMNLICNIKLFNGLWFYTNPIEIIPPHHMRHTPTESAFWSELFSFGRIEYVIDVPHDPYLKYARYNDGVEFLYSARLLTSGYRMYAPAQDIIYYEYNQKSSRIRLPLNERQTLVQNVRSDQYRIRVIMNLDQKSKFSKQHFGGDNDFELRKESKKFGLGKKLSLNAYYDMIGVDSNNLRFSTNSLCKQILNDDFRTESLA